jgi:2-polyprenyl-6-methoxyphenol hydroxylase-like FAD-dependent oxidoreductase
VARPPWGVAEAHRLGLHAHYLEHGANVLDTHASYCETLDSESAPRFDLAGLMGVEQLPLCMPHALMCETLATAATAAGATLLRGVKRTQVTPGPRPRVQFEHGGRTHVLSPRLVVGADGRNGFTARQVGVAMHEDTPRHLLAGLRVRGADGWPPALHCMSTEGELHAQVFPQGDGYVRLYAAIPLERRAWLLGDQGAERLLASFRLRSVPESAALAAAIPAGPCRVYPNHHTWAATPWAPGCALIGDAAGRNDPTTGQGLSLCHWDARVLGELLLATPTWDDALLRHYGELRGATLARLRASSRFCSARDATFGEEGRALRMRVRARTMTDPLVRALTLSPLVGPMHTPAEAYAEATVAAAIA